MEDCIFSKIVNKEAPVTVVFENEEFLAFPTIQPITKGHTLLIPKVHSENIFDIDASSFERMAGVAKKLAKELVDSNGATGINVLHASGKDAQQSVFHFHLHIVPSYPNDGADLWLRNKL